MSDPMYAADQGKLAQAITAINQWKATASSAGIKLSQVNLVFPDGSPVVFAWDEEKQDWKIDT